MARGTLRIYLGAAPGVGKTFAMLERGAPPRASGAPTSSSGSSRPTAARTTASRSATSRSSPAARWSTAGRRSRRWTSTPSSPARRQVALVDELAHTNAPGVAHAKRWEDVEELLDAGIDVISTVNIQHLESLNDVVERDHRRHAARDRPRRGACARADQIELVDMTPEALRRRMAHGNIYPAEQIDAALAQLLPRGQPRRAARARAAVGGRPGRRGAAGVHGAPRHRGAVGDARARRRRASPARPEASASCGAPRAWPTRGAGRSASASTSVPRTASPSPSATCSTSTASCSTELGGRYIEVVGRRIPQALLDFARAENATQLVDRARPPQSRWAELTSWLGRQPGRSARRARSTST